MILRDHPTVIIRGKKARHKISQIVGSSKVALVTSSGMSKRKAFRQIKKQLDKNISVTITDVRPNPSLNSFLKLRTKIMKAKIDVWLAIGGGSVIDATKTLSYLHATGFSQRDFVSFLKGKKEKALIRPCPILAAPTTAGTGSEVTCWATIWDLKRKIKYSLAHPTLYPTWAVLDPELTYTMPYETSLFTGLDALSHAFEAIWNRSATKKSDRLAEKAIRILATTLRNRYRHTYKNENVRWKMQQASLLAGLASSVTRTALAHSVSYPFTIHLKVTHGLACSFTLPEILTFNYSAKPKQIQKIVRAMGATTVGKAQKNLYRLFSLTGASRILNKKVSLNQISTRLKKWKLITLNRAGNNLAPVNQKKAEQLVLAALRRHRGD